MSRVATIPIGETFNRLTVRSAVGHSKNRSVLVLCVCECGKEHTTRLQHVVSGATKSCGCAKVGVNKTHSESNGGGKRGSAEYRTWAGMLRRCRNPRDKSFRHYGGRGIVVCDRWLKFENFLADMGRKPSEKHSIERKNYNRNYEPDNCRWATAKEQANNIRTNHLIEFRSKTQTMAMWADELGIKYRLILNRLRRGWTVERTMTTP